MRQTLCSLIGLLMTSIRTLGDPGSPESVALQSQFPAVVIAGGGNGDGLNSAYAALDPTGIAIRNVGSGHDIYIADYGNDRIRKVDVNGVISTVAGNGVGGYSGDGGPATSASLSAPFDVALDANGTIYIADGGNHRVRRVRPDGIIDTIAGGASPAAGLHDGDPALQSYLSNPSGVEVDPLGTVYIVDRGAQRVLKLAPVRCAPLDCVIQVVAGNGTAGFSGDGGAARAASLRNPAQIAISPDGAFLYIADADNSRVRVVFLNGPNVGTIQTFAGGGFPGPGNPGDGLPATQARLIGPFDVSVTPNGSVLIADAVQFRIRKVVNGIISTVAGTGTSTPSGELPRGLPSTQTPIRSPFGVRALNDQDFLHSETTALPRSFFNVVRESRNGISIPVVGGTLPSVSNAQLAPLFEPYGLLALTPQTILLVDFRANALRQLSCAGDACTIRLLAGTGEAGTSGDGGAALSARLNGPIDVAADASGAIYFADYFSNTVRRISPGRIITTVAGVPGQFGISEDGGDARRSVLSRPYGVAVDRAGIRLYIAEQAGCRVRIVNLLTSIISTVVGTPGQCHTGGDGGPAVLATLAGPSDVAVRETSTGIALLVVDEAGHRVRRVGPDGIITTIAGNGTSGFSGDGGPATEASLSSPNFVALDSIGTVYISDANNRRIRRVSAQNQAIATIFTAPGPNDDFTGLSVSPDDQSLLVAERVQHKIYRVSLTGSPSPTPVPLATLRGRVGYYTNGAVGVPGAILQLAPINGNPLPSVQTNSDAQGNYSFSPVNANQDWRLTLVKKDDYRVAVSSLDATRVLQHVAGLAQLSPRQAFACDATGTGSLTALDATRILQFVAGISPALPAVQNQPSDWSFFPDFSAQPGITPVQPAFSGAVPPVFGGAVLTPLGPGTTTLDFSGALIGDCTGNWH